MPLPIAHSVVGAFILRGHSHAWVSGTSGDSRDPLAESCAGMAWSSVVSGSVGIEAFSPLAWGNAVSVILNANASLNESKVIGQVSWSAEWMWWNQFFSGRPVASLFHGAVSSRE